MLTGRVLSVFAEVSAYASAGELGRSPSALFVIQRSAHLAVFGL